MQKSVGVALMLFLCVTGTVYAQPRTMQVTCGSGVTQILSAGAHLPIRWLLIQDNAGDNVRAGDAQTTSTQGALIYPGGSLYIPPSGQAPQTDLGGWYLYCPSGDKIDIVYDDGQ